MTHWRLAVWRPGPAVGVLIAANVAVFVLQAAQGAVGQEWIIRYGLIPAALFQGDRFAIPGAPAPYALTLLTSSFLHGNLGHLAVNLAFIAVLGSMVERALGAWRFAVLWTAAVTVGGVGHAVLNSGSIIPTIGASAGVAGLIGVIAVSGWIGLVVGGLWLSLQIVGAAAHAPAFLDPEVAWQAHVAGFATGVMGGLLVRWEIRRRRRRSRTGRAVTPAAGSGAPSRDRRAGTHG